MSTLEWIRFAIGAGLIISLVVLAWGVTRQR